MWRAEVPLKKDWAVGVSLISVILSFAWLLSINPECCVEYYPVRVETVSYSKILQDHQQSIFNSPATVFIVLLIVNLILAFFTRRLWLILLLAIPFICVCGFAFAVTIFRDGTFMSQIDEATFDGQNFYLVHASNTTRDMEVSWESLLLFECATGTEDCHARLIERYSDFPTRASLKVEADQLHIYADNELIFTLDSSDYRFPDE